MHLEVLKLMIRIFVPFYFKQDSDGDQDADLSTSTLQNTVTEGESTLVVDDPDSK